ncbi:MAG: hypothetical protein V1907_04280 [Candidatus Kerfeldbacteria bacterium]
MKKGLLILVIVVIIAAALWFVWSQRKSGNSGDVVSAQQEVIDAYGQPAQFAITYVPQESDTASFLARNEVWFYPEIGKKVTFLGGSIASVDEYVPEATSTATTLSPQDFDYSMSKSDIEKAIGGSGMEAVDYLPGLYEEGVVESYLSAQALIVFEQGHLTYIQTFGTGEAANAVSVSEGFPSRYSLVPAAEAKIRLKNAFRCIKNVCQFIVSLPDRATRWMGPVVGPIVSAIITKNIVKNPNLNAVFGRAERINRIINDINEQQKLVTDVKKMYSDAATDLRNRAAELRQAHEDLKEQLRNRDITMAEFRENVVALELMAQQFDKGAERFTSEAEKISVANVVKMLGRDLLNRVLGQAQQIVYQEVGNEIRRLINFDVLERIIDQDKRGGDAILDLLFGGDLERLFPATEREGFDLDALRSRIRDEIKRMLRENKEDLQKNWKQRMSEIIDRLVKQLKEEKAQYQNANQANANDNENTNTAAPEITVDEHGCKPGYTFSPQSGISCIQANCTPDKIPNAHWSYEGYCVCGSSGSIAENVNDPNQECSYPSDYATCPGCVYACVGLKDACPSPAQ